MAQSVEAWMQPEMIDACHSCSLTRKSCQGTSTSFTMPCTASSFQFRGPIVGVAWSP